MRNAVTFCLLLTAPLDAAPVKPAGDAEERAAALIEDAGGTVYRNHDGGAPTGVKAGARAFGKAEIDALRGCPALTWLDLREARLSGPLDLSPLRRLRGVGLLTRCLAKGFDLTLGSAVVELYIEGEGDPLPGLKPLVERIEALELSNLGEIKPEMMTLLVKMSGLTSLSFAHSTYLTEDGVKKLAELPRLRTLRFHTSPDKVPAVLAGMKELENLEVGPLSDLSFLKHMPRLRSLILHDPTANDTDLAPVAGLEKLEELLLIRALKITDKGLAHLAGLKKLRELDLVGTPIRGDGLRHVTPGLRKLRLFGTFTDEAMAEVAKMTDLEDLSLSEGRFTDKALAMLAALRRLKTFHVSLMASPGIDTPGDAGMACLRGMERLEDFALWNGGFTDKGMAHLAGCKNLRVLELGRLCIKGEGLKHLAGCAALGEVRLPYATLEDRHLGALGKLPALWNLSLYGAPIDGETLPAMPGLRRLELGATKTTDAALSRLAGCKKLEWLSLGETAVTDAGLKHAAKLSNLRELSLCGLKIGDAALLDLEPLGRLRVLNLNKTTVTDAGLKNLRTMARLRLLWLNGTKATPEGMAVLRKALPGAEVMKQY